MPSGKALIAESSTVSALMSRQWSHRRPLPAGVVSLLTVVCWAIWVYLVLPLVSLLLWAFGLRLFISEITKGGYEGLRASLVAYSSVLLVLVGLLALWIAWNVTRYGGSHDRRTVKRAEVSDPEIQRAFRLDDSLLAVLRDERLVRIDLDREDCVVVLATERPGTPIPPIPESLAIPASPAVAGAGRSAAPDRLAPPSDQRAEGPVPRERDSARSG